MIPPKTCWNTPWSSGLSARSRMVSTTPAISRYSATTMMTPMTHLSRSATTISKRSYETSVFHPSRTLAPGAERRF